MIAVPYHLGRRGIAVGRGPLKIVEALGEPCEMIERTEGEAGELQAVADVNSRLANAVAVHDGPPIVLAGNCNSCIGTLSGILGKHASVGVVWFDAHGDFNTPETTISGALEGMSLAIAVGDCYAPMMLQPIDPQNVVLAATRSIDPLERERLNRSAVNQVNVEGMPAAVADLAKRVDAIYLHVDLDVLDPRISPGVNFSESGGLEPEQLFDAVRIVASTGKLRAAAITNFDPDRDVDDRTLKIAQKLVAILSEASLR